MVIDDGFDKDHSVFKGKILASYTLDCGESGGAYVESAASTANDIVSALTTRDNYCVLREGLTINKSKSFKDIAKYRDRWNDAILNKRAVDQFEKDPREKILDVLSGETGTYTYHGTETAGLIAFQNPGIKLVLVQYGVTSANDANKTQGVSQGTTAGASVPATSLPPALAPKVVCPTQAELDKRAKTLSDPIVTAAFSKAVSPSFERLVTDLVQKHRVTLMSYSIAKMTRQAREAEIKAIKECAPVNFRAYYKARGAYEGAVADAVWRERDATGVRALFVRAAGNDGYTIDSLEDSLDCWNGRGAALTVGSFDVNGRVSEFSNRGQCVDSYVLGNRMVVASPDGFLSVASGTSFSTPLLTRYLMRHYPATTSRTAMVADIKAKLNGDGLLPLTVLPEELAYQSNVAIERYALSGAGAAPGDLPTRNYYDARDLPRPHGPLVDPSKP